MASHRLSASVIVAESDRVLVVCDDSAGTLRWRLPRAVVRSGEPLRAAARRGFEEEVGRSVRVGELAFVTETVARAEPLALHFAFAGRLVEEGAPWAAVDRPEARCGARFVPVGELGAHIADRPLWVALGAWLEERTIRYHVFDLDRISALGT